MDAVDGVARMMAPCFKRGRVVLRAHPGYTPRMLLEACRWDVRAALAVARVVGAPDTYLSSLIWQAADTVPVISRRARMGYNQPPEHNHCRSSLVVDHGTWWSSTTITPESAAAPSPLADFGGGDSGGAGAGSSWGDSGASSCDSGGGGDSSGGGDSGGGGCGGGGD